MPVCPLPPSPHYSLQGQLFILSASSADQRLESTEAISRTRSQPCTDFCTWPLSGPSQQTPLKLWLDHATATEGRLSDSPDSSTLLSGPLLLQLQFLVPAGSVAAIWINWVLSSAVPDSTMGPPSTHHERKHSPNAKKFGSEKSIPGPCQSPRNCRPWGCLTSQSAFATRWTGERPCLHSGDPYLEIHTQTNAMSKGYAENPNSRKVWNFSWNWASK